MGVKTENRVIAALTGPSTLAEIARRAGIKEHEALTTLSNLLMEGTVKRNTGYPCLFWLANR